MTDTMMTTNMIMTVMADVEEGDDRVINTRIIHSTHSTHFFRSIHHSIADHTIVHTATNLNKVPTLKKLDYLTIHKQHNHLFDDDCKNDESSQKESSCHLQ